MNSRKRVLAVTTTAALSLATVAACSGNDDGGGGSGDGETPTEITFSYLWAGPEGQAVEDLIEQFNESQDDVVVSGVSSPDTAAQLAALSGTRAQFDVSDHFGDAVGTWADQGLLADLSPMIESDDYDLTDFVDGSLEPLTVDGQVYSLPLATYTYQLVYNQTILDEAGIEPPTTFDELVDAGTALTTVENGTVTRLGFGPLDLRSMVWAAGGEWVQDGAPSPTTEELETVAGLYLQQLDDSGTNPSTAATFTSSFGDYWSSDNPFYTGQVAMTLDGPWHTAMTQQYAPEDFEWGVTSIPVPSDRPELEGTAPLHISTIFIPQNSEKKEAAWEFVKFMMEPEAQVYFNTALANISPRTSLADDADLADLGENYMTFVELQNSGQLKSLPAAPWTNEYLAVIGQTQTDIYEGNVSLADGVARLANDASSLAD